MMGVGREPGLSPAKRYFELRVESLFVRLALRRVAGEASSDVAGELRERQARARAAVEAAREEGDGRRSADLASRLNLEAIDVEFLWLAAAMSTAPAVVTQAEAMIGSRATKGVSLSLLELATDQGRGELRDLARRLDDDHPLLRSGFLIATDAQAVLPARTFQLAHRVVRYLAGDDHVDPSLVEAGGVVEVGDELQYDPEQLQTIDKLANLLARGPTALIVVEGPKGSGRRTAIARAARLAGLGEVVALDLGRASDPGGGLHALQRECLLRDALPIVAECGHWSGSADELGRLLRPMATGQRSLVLTSSLPGAPVPVDREVVRITWPLPSASTRRTLWDAYLGADADEVQSSLDEVCVRYRLGPGGIRAAARVSRLHTEPDSPLSAANIVEGVRNNVFEYLGDLAQRVAVTQTWDDLILPEDASDQVEALIARVRHAHLVYETWGLGKKMPRGVGVSGLFSGPPGTGKTMVAGLIAKELDLELYQVDLSKVVSKWVGETEKQLSKIFDAAEAGHALLLFDEADALFAKRTEVKAAVDRYANLEVNYLLQRVEAFGGITILTTNLDASIDPALRRRLSATVVFDLPGEEERILLWRKHLDANIDIGGTLDLEALAQEFSEMSGANIRNAVVAAAFLAATESCSLTQDHLMRAARGEYRTTMGRVLC